MWYLLEGKSNQDFCKQNYNIRLDVSYISMVCQWMCIVGLASWKQINLVVRNGEKNHLLDQQQCTRYQDMCQFIQAIKPHLVPQLQPELPPVTGAVMHCHSPRLTCILHGPNRQTEWGSSSITMPASFKSVTVALTSTTPSEMRYCFLFTIFLHGGSSSGSTWPFPP